MGEFIACSGAGSITDGIDLEGWVAFLNVVVYDAHQWIDTNKTEEQTGKDSLVLHH